MLFSLALDGSQISTLSLAESPSICPGLHALFGKNTFKSVDDSWDLRSLLAERRDLEALAGQSKRGSDEGAGLVHGSLVVLDYKVIIIEF